MSVPYWHHSGCGRNTEIPEEVLERVRNKEGSLDDLMTPRKEKRLIALSGME